MDLLLNDEFAPITSSIGFLETSLSATVQAFWDWQQKILQNSPGGESLAKHSVSGRLQDVLPTLLPLTSHGPQRYLFVPTASPWIAYFDNGWRGSDPFGPISYLATEIPCRGLLMTAIPNTIKKTETSIHGRYGSIKLDIYGSEQTDWLNLIRSISAMNDGGEWVFSERGTPMPFEQIENYQANCIWDRFTFDMLKEYLYSLGLSPFDETFYLPPANPNAVVIEKIGTLIADRKEYTLPESRKRL
jgi:hypothetical protein